MCVFVCFVCLSVYVCVFVCVGAFAYVCVCVCVFLFGCTMIIRARVIYSIN